MSKICKLLNDPRIIERELLCNYLAPLFSDRKYIEIKSKLFCGYKFNLDNPTTFNEKLNWLKLNDHNPLYTTMVDKVAAKKYVGDIIGQEYIVPMIAEWDNADAIDFQSLPEQCMIKANYDSGGIVTYKRGMDEKAVRDKVKGNKYYFNYYYRSREWPYKDVPHKVFAEEFLDNDGRVITDYKFWCFNGEPKIMYVTCKSSDVFENFYDMDFKPMDIDHGSRREKPEFDKPESFETMKLIARKLSKDIPFVRIDFLLVKGKLYFGECTFFDWGGFRPFAGDWDEKIGKMLVLPIDK